MASFMSPHVNCNFMLCLPFRHDNENEVWAYGLPEESLPLVILNPYLRERDAHESRACGCEMCCFSKEEGHTDPGVRTVDKDGVIHYEITNSLYNTCEYCGTGPFRAILYEMYTHASGNETLFEESLRVMYMSFNRPLDQDLPHLLWEYCRLTETEY
jgi:hypothetical protein